MNAQFEQALLLAQIEVQESTFSTLGKELHDNIGQLLSTAKMMISITKQTVPNAPNALHTAYDTLSKAIIELRAISKTLNKEWLEQFDLVDNLKAEAEHINSAKVVKVHFSSEVKLSINRDKQIILFRIIQEAIQNAIKHASPGSIDISINTYDEKLIVIIKDDGVGFDESVKSLGVGILNMRQRAKMLGGVIEWKNNKDGCSVAIRLPEDGEQE